MTRTHRSRVAPASNATPTGPQHRTRKIMVPMAIASIALLTACSAVAPKDSPAATETAHKGLAINQALHDQLPEGIRSSGVLKVGIDPTYPPMEFTDEQNKIIGSDPELIEAMGEVLGVKIEYVTSKFSAIIPSLNAGRFDVGMNMGDYLKREAEADFLDFFVAKRAFLVDASATELNAVNDLCGLTVGMLQGTDAQDKVDEANVQCASEGKEAVTANAYPTNNEAVLALGNGRIDAVFSDTPTAGYAAVQSKGKLKTTGTAVYGLPPYYGMLLNKDSALLSPLEAALNEVITSGRYAEIFTKWGLEDGLIDVAVINGAKE